jgi:hypothetical protein
VRQKPSELGTQMSRKIMTLRQNIMSPQNRGVMRDFLNKTVSDASGIDIGDIVIGEKEKRKGLDFNETPIHKVDVSPISHRSNNTKEKPPEAPKLHKFMRKQKNLT